MVGTFTEPEDDQFLKKLEEYLKRKTAASKIHVRANKELFDYENKLIKERRMLTVATRLSGGGGLGASVMNMMQQIGGIKMGNFQRLQTLKAKEKTDILDPKEARERDMLGGNKASNSLFKRLDNVFEKNFGGDSKWNKMFGGQGKVAAAGLGAGAIGGGIVLSKMIIDNSPAFQQLLKMTKFATMMILRPIGDFFGFLFRPILILLLRKFIIPFYQTVYPWFVRNGKLIGDTVAAILDSGENIGKIITESGKVVMAGVSNSVDNVITKILPPAGAESKSILNPVKKATGSFTDDMAKVVGDTAKFQANSVKASNSIIKTGTKAEKVIIGAAKAVKLMDAVASAPAKVIMKVLKPLTGFIATSAGAITHSVTLGASSKIGDAGKKVTKPVTNAAANILTKVATKVGANVAFKTATKFIPIIGQALLAVDAAGSALQKLNPELYTGINKGIRAGAGALGIPDWLTEGGLDLLGWGEESTLQQIEGLVGSAAQALGVGGGGNVSSGRRFAKGGIIREPIKGIGKSGKKYSFGESGSEMVIPMNKMGSGGSGVTVNITVNGSIYSDKDMIKFQRTIMRAIESSNTRKARL